MLALPALYFLLQKSLTPVAQVAAIIYGLGIFVLFAVSALYHSVPKSEYGLRFWQKLDHCCIYVMIAGSFTPTALIVFDGWISGILFGLVWLISLVGCLLKVFNKLKNEKISIGLYIAMGCLIIPFMTKMMGKIPFMGLFWLFIGGVFYIGGTYYYAKDKPLYKHLHSHELWHVFVNFGALSHFFYNYYYVFEI